MSEIDARPVLIAYDGSEHARVAIEQTAALLRSRGNVVTCVWSPVEDHVRPVAALLGSTAEGVLHHAQRPVLVVSGE